jgi:hypothetical protein
MAESSGSIRAKVPTAFALQTAIQSFVAFRQNQIAMDRFTTQVTQRKLELAAMNAEALAQQSLALQEQAILTRLGNV